MDPNASGLALMTASASHGSGVGALSIAFSMQGMLGDGMNLYQYLGGNPWTRRDPMGLSYDPWADIDLIISEHAAALTGMLDVLIEAGTGAAKAIAFVLSMAPVPGVSIIGDVGLYLLGAQSGSQTIMAIALGVVPGAVLATKYAKPLKAMLSRVTGRAVRYLTDLAMKHAGIMKKLSGIVAGGLKAAGSTWVGRAVMWAARKAARVAGLVGCGCFTASTLVLTANGAVPIGDIQEGQQVLAADDQGLSQDYSSNTVGTKIVVGEASLVQLLVLHEDGSSEVISTTDEHPFHVADTAAWTRADGLVIGDHLSTISGTALLEGVVYTTERVPVYNLSIPGSPTYYVGEHGVWVHNAKCSFNLGPDWFSHFNQDKHNFSRLFNGNTPTEAQLRTVIDDVWMNGSTAAEKMTRDGLEFWHESVYKGHLVTLKGFLDEASNTIRLNTGWVD